MNNIILAKENIKIIPCDYSNYIHCKAVVDLMREYMQDAMGNSPPLDAEGNHRLIEGLKSHPTAITLLALYDSTFVGLTNSFLNFATFKAYSFLNIHDLIVHKNYRGKKIGDLLMEATILFAKYNQCSKITLEVREDNLVAQKLYEKYGFSYTQPKMLFWVKDMK
ncbi:MAG: GNAT family N-acetyltransferase [Bacteroidales bacterium]